MEGERRDHPAQVSPVKSIAALPSRAAAAVGVPRAVLPRVVVAREEPHAVRSRVGRHGQPARRGHRPALWRRPSSRATAAAALPRLPRPAAASRALPAPLCSARGRVGRPARPLPAARRVGRPVLPGRQRSPPRFGALHRAPQQRLPLEPALHAVRARGAWRHPVPMHGEEGSATWLGLRLVRVRHGEEG